LQIPATEAGIDAAAVLQREDGINVNLAFVSGVMHAATCAQAGAVAVTLSIEKVCLSFFFSFILGYLARKTLTPQKFYLHSAA
jgi:transaldolase